MNLRKIAISLALFAAINVNANDTLFVRQQQIPVLIDRPDNIVAQMRITAPEGKTMQNIEVELSQIENLKDVKAVKLYYAGTESPLKNQSTSFAPVQYISRENPKGKFGANPSYSLLLGSIKPKGNKITFTFDQKLYPAGNYFWISVEMNNKTNLNKTFNLKIVNAMVNGSKVTIDQKESSPTFRMGYGVRYAGDDNSAAYRIPGMVTTKKGTLLAVYDVRYNSGVDLQEHVDVGLSRSTDGGQSWEKMRTIMDFGTFNGLPEAQNGVGDPAILVDDITGTIWAIACWTHGMGNARSWTNSQQGMSVEKTAQLMLVKSTDDGKTWSKPINITSQVKDPSWYFLLQGPGMGITMSDGTLVFPIQFIDKDRIPNAGIMYSKDRGETWEIHNLARTNTTEAQVAEVEPGVLMLNMRDNRGGSRAVATTSDFGRTWSEHPSSRSALQEPVCMASLIKVNAKDNVLGKDILLFSNPNSTTGRNNITIKASLDGGLTWKEGNQILIDQLGGWGYSCLSMVDNETVGIIYEGSQAHMVFQTVKLKDLVKSVQ